MVPGLGDDIQAIKAGILEIGDIFVVNKADREGADRTARELATMLEYRSAPEGSWNPQVLKTEAPRGTGIEELVGEILLHRDYLLSSGTIDHFLRERNERHFMDILRDGLINRALGYMLTDSILDRVVAGMGDRTIDPYSAAEQVLAGMMGDR
jgi:LAO/AO transport system kinase